LTWPGSRSEALESISAYISRVQRSCAFILSGCKPATIRQRRISHFTPWRQLATPGGIYGTLLAVTHGPPGSGHAPVKLRSHTLHRLWSMIWGTLGANAANADCAHGDLGADPVRPLAALALRSPLHKPASLGTAGKIG